MRDEIERLMRVVFDTRMEIDALDARGTDDALHHIDRVLLPLLTQTHAALLAAAASWPAEWATPIRTWCEAWTVWGGGQRWSSLVEEDAVDRAAEDLGLLLGADGALELRARADVERIAARQRNAEQVRGAHDIAERMVGAWSPTLQLEPFEGPARALVELAIVARVAAMMLDEDEPLAGALDHAARAATRLVEIDGADAELREEIWLDLATAIDGLRATLSSPRLPH